MSRRLFVCVVGADLAGRLGAVCRPAGSGKVGAQLIELLARDLTTRVPTLDGGDRGLGTLAAFAEQPDDDPDEEQSHQQRSEDHCTHDP